MNARNLPQASHDSFQMLYVFNIDHDVDGRLAVGGAGFDVADIGIAVADHCSQLFQHGGAVIAEDRQLDRVGGFAAGCSGLDRLRPFHGYAPVGFIHEVGYIRATHRVYSHAFAAGHVADHGFAADGVATSRAIHHQVVITFHLDGAGLRALAKDAP